MNRTELESHVIHAIKITLADSTGEQDVNVTTACRVDRSIGLDSLGWATVILRLQADLGVDPFRSQVTGDLRTVSDLVDLYEASLTSM